MEYDFSKTPPPEVDPYDRYLGKPSRRVYKSVRDINIVTLENSIEKYDKFKMRVFKRYTTRRASIDLDKHLENFCNCTMCLLW
jgi:hypothetical protein